MSRARSESSSGVSGRLSNRCQRLLRSQSLTPCAALAACMAPIASELILLLALGRDRGIGLIFVHVLFQVGMFDEVGIAVTGLGNQVQSARSIARPNAHRLGFLGRDFDGAGIANTGAFRGHDGPG